ncbi:MFS transporter [Sediminitomix flava]|uniref:PAT family beta-lactamase induction signal transducer AmpG n=1 Tax=Sediminitomix flava TaxID=379075 RepID=A0A315ZFP5_SEDFL|nr:MFS transporter [Sediminitomix flava]PWJ44395.1 PAT family beta-lactamase induction signal transducer AmpG [Sediminitomix flava]
MRDTTLEREQIKQKSPWTWIPSLYFMEGLPYGLVMYVTTILYKNMGLSNTELAFYTSWLYLPWVIKPIWSPFIDILKTKRWWILIMQFVIGVALAGIAFTLNTEFWFQASLAFFWLIAFSSATHDIAADGFYMIGASKDDQAYFIGIRSLFYRISMVFTQGGVVVLGGYLEKEFNSVPMAWSVTLGVMAILMAVSWLYHSVFIPKVETTSEEEKSAGNIINEFFATFKTFFEKEGVWLSIAFLLLYRFGEAQLVKMAQPFLLDTAEVGGLGLSTTEVGTVYGTVGPIGLILGGILGGMAVSKYGLKKMIWIMLVAINLPHMTYIYLSWVLPENLYLIGGSIIFETFGYGFGFTAYMMYMIHMSEGKYKTAHFAIATAFMALSMMIPGLFSGKLQEVLGYDNFFVWVLLSGIPSIWIVKKIHEKLPEKE